MNFVGGHRGARARRRRQGIHTLIDPLALALLVVTVKPSLGLPPQSATLDHPLQRVRRAHALSKRGSHDRARLAGNIETDFVEQCQWPNRKPERHQRLVDRIDRRPFVEQFTAFVDVRRQYPVHVKARSVAHHDDGLADLPTVRHHRGRGLRTRLGRDDHLQQRHLVHG